MKVRAGSSARHADRTDLLPLLYRIANFDVDPRQMKEGAVEPHAVIKHQEVAFERERAGGGKNDDSVSRGEDGRTKASRQIDTGVRRTRYSGINALGTEMASDAAGDRPDEVLPPALGSGRDASGGGDLFKLCWAAGLKFGVGLGMVRQP